MTINKYMITMTDSKGSDPSWKQQQTIASSEEEAIKKMVDDPWWYREGTGWNYRPLVYPLIFTAKIYNG